MSTRYIIEVELDNEDPSDVLDWIVEQSGDEGAAVHELHDTWRIG